MGYFNPLRIFSGSSLESYGSDGWVASEEGSVRHTTEGENLESFEGFSWRPQDPSLSREKIPLSFLLCPRFHLTSSGDKATDQLRMEASLMDLDEEESVLSRFCITLSWSSKGLQDLLPGTQALGHLLS